MMYSIITLYMGITIGFCHVMFGPFLYIMVSKTYFILVLTLAPKPKEY